MTIRSTLAAITGRFQPFHLDHLALAQRALADYERITIGITNPDPRSQVRNAASPHRHRAEANPLTYFERLSIIRSALEMAGVPSARFDIVPFPLEQETLWYHYIPAENVQLVRTFSEWEDTKVDILRGGGYTVQTIAGNPATRISASDIRAAIAAGSDAWRDQVPAGTRAVLDSWCRETLRRRCQGTPLA